LDRGRVVFVVNSLIAGGAEGQAARIAVGLKQRGWDTSIFCISRTGELVTGVESQGVPTAGRTPADDAPLYNVALAAPRLLGHLRTRRPDIVITFITRSDLLGAVSSRIAGVKHVVTTRLLCHEYTGLPGLAYRAAMRISDGCSDRVVAVSDVVMEQARAEGTPQDKLLTIPNSVSTTELPSGRPIQFQGEPVIGTVARLHNDKGNDTLIQALPRVLDHLPNARLVLVGEGPERSHLESLARSLGVSGRVELLGSRTDIPDLLASFDMFALPSRREGLPNALLEAMVGRLPVITTGVGGVPEVIEDGVNGLLVQPESHDELATKIVELWADCDLRRRLGDAARQTAISRYGGLDRELSAYEALFASLLDRRDSSRRASKQVPDVVIGGGDEAIPAG